MSSQLVELHHVTLLNQQRASELNHVILLKINMQNWIMCHCWLDNAHVWGTFRTWTPTPSMTCQTAVGLCRNSAPHQIYISNEFPHDFVDWSQHTHVTIFVRSFVNLYTHHTSILSTLSTHAMPFIKGKGLSRKYTVHRSSSALLTSIKSITYKMSSKQTRLEEIVRRRAEAI